MRNETASFSPLLKAGCISEMTPCQISDKAVASYRRTGLSPEIASLSIPSQSWRTNHLSTTSTPSSASASGTKMFAGTGRENVPFAKIDCPWENRLSIK